MTGRQLFVCGLALAVIGAARASALDLTGTWVGKYTCTEYDGSRSKLTVKDDELRITQQGDALAVDSENAFRGVAIAHAGKPETRGEIKLVRCGTDNVVSNGGDELGRFTVKIDREKGKGKLKGTALYTFPGGVGTCKLRYKLASTENPGATGCN